jgi:hypothetical protein
MSVLQGIQTKQYALEQRRPSADDETLRRARLIVAGMAARQDLGVDATREVLEALGLLEARVELRAASS